MRNCEEELKTKWNSINYREGGSLQLAGSHPLEWHICYPMEGHKGIVIVSDMPADKIRSSESIEAKCGMRKDGRYAISFTLMNREQEDVFIAMSSDLIKFSSLGANPKASLQMVLQRYAAWMRLLDNKRNALLSLNAQKGLLAELFFLKENIERGMNPSEAVSGWVGPDGADQDFVYIDGWHEIKATGASSSQVTISSVEQLDNPAKGELVVFRVDKCAPAYVGAVTLFGTVHNLFNMITYQGGTPDDFILKLGAAGYIDMEDYKKQHFIVSAKQSYCVNNAFPRIKRAALSAEIANAEYQLDLPSLSLWMIKNEKFAEQGNLNF